ncbi:MAG: Protein T2 [Marteilia pararefringens]
MQIVGGEEEEEELELQLQQQRGEFINNASGSRDLQNSDEQKVDEACDDQLPLDSEELSFLSEYVPFIEKNSGKEFLNDLSKYWSKESIEYLSFDRFDEEYRFKDKENIKYLIIIDKSMICSFDLYERFMSKYYEIFDYNVPICTLQYISEKLVTKSSIDFKPWILMSDKLKQFSFSYDDYAPMACGDFKLLLKSLGGSISPTINDHVSFFITFSVLSKSYPVARKYNIRILKYSFIEQLLEPENVLNDYTGHMNCLLPFDGLIFFLFSSANDKELDNSSSNQIEENRKSIEKIIENNGGVLSKSIHRYTHLIYFSGNDAKDNSAMSNIETIKAELSNLNISESFKDDLIVNQWVRDCAKCQYFLDPSSYMLFKNINYISIEDTSSLSIGKFCNVMKSTSRSQEMTFRKPLRSYSSQQRSAVSDTITSHVFDKESMSNFSPRLALLQEIKLTELKYVNDLVYLDEYYGKRISCPERDDKYNPESCLTLQEYKTVFQPFQDLLTFHLQFYERLFNLVDDYDEITTRIGDLFILNIDSFFKYYRFLRRYGDIREIMQRPPFQIIYNNISMNRIKIAEGLDAIKPHECAFRAFQRLSGYTLLLQRLVKKTSEDHVDYFKLKEAYEKMQSLLDVVNENIANHRNELIHMELVYYLDKCPPIIKSSNYPLLLHLECCSINKNQQRSTNFHLYCFKSCIELAKFKETSNIQLSPKIGISNSKSSFNVSSKPFCTNSTRSIYKFKHVEQIWYENIKELALVDDPQHGKLLGMLYWCSGQDAKSQSGQTVPAHGSLLNLESMTQQENRLTINYRFFKCPYEINVEKQINTIHNLITDCIQNDENYSHTEYPDFVFNTSSVDDCLRKWKDSSFHEKHMTYKSLTGEMSRNCGKKSPKSFNKRLSTNLSSMFGFLKVRSATKFDSSIKNTNRLP